MSQRTFRETDGQDDEGTRFKHNPAPRRAYTVTMTIADAPGPFASVEGVAQYDVGNYNACGENNGATGTRMRITSNEPIVLEKMSDTEYRGVVYADLMLDEDYFGAGLCRWEFDEMRVQLKATGAQSETRFLAHIPAKSVESGASLTQYLWNGYYPRAKSDNFPEIGEGSLSDVPEDRRGEFFTITLTAKDGNHDDHIARVRRSLG